MPRIGGNQPGIFVYNALFRSKRAIGTPTPADVYVPNLDIELATNGIADFDQTDPESTTSRDPNLQP